MNSEKPTNEQWPQHYPGRVLKRKSTDPEQNSAIPRKKMPNTQKTDSKTDHERYHWPSSGEKEQEIVLNGCRLGKKEDDDKAKNPNPKLNI